MVGKIGGLDTMTYKEVIPKGCTPFGMFIFRAAEHKNLTLQEVALKTGITKQTLRIYLTGSRYPKIDRYIALIEVISDSREEFQINLVGGLSVMSEHMFADRRLRYKEKINDNNNPK
jgi:transcriptional regulator with XRE-family HTH domain